MLIYFTRRILQSVFTLLVISMILYGLISSVPGGFMSAYTERADFTPEDLARIRAKFGLDDPIPVRYAKWLVSMLQGDMGSSFTTKRPVMEEIADRLPNTLLLMGLMMVCTLLVAIPLGILSAVKQYTWFDHIATTAAFAGQSLPVFWFGLLLIIVFAVTLKGGDGRPLLPGSGMYTLGEPFSLWDRIRHLILPVSMLTFVSAAEYMRYLRSSMLDVIHEDYVRTARAKGLRENPVIVHHALRNALIPVVTLIGLQAAFLLGGAVVTETMFSWPGVGRLAVGAIISSDFPTAQGAIMILAIAFLVINLIVDVLYVYLDPRVQRA